jgi:serpin B
MHTRRQTLQVLGALGLGGLGLATPVLAACGGSGSAVDDGGMTGLRLVNADVARSPGDPEGVAGVVDSMGAFTLDLWQALGEPRQNLALSPYSIAVALAMTANGARGETAARMLEVLHVGSLASYNAGMAALTQELAALAGSTRIGGEKVEIQVSPANQLFGDVSVEWQKAFLTVLAKEYGAGLRTVDFRHEPEAARALVNDWTSTQTHDRIPEILPKGTVDVMTRLVLVNALYFKAPWAVPFEKSATRPGRFARPDGTTVTVPMMSTDEGPTYLAGRHFRGARLRYADGRLAMTVALPPAGDEEAALHELLGGGTHAQGGTGLRLTMPRWTYRVATDLKPMLVRLGMGVAFGDGADFGAMTDDADLEISEVRHQTYVAVDEAGTEAAAATAVGMRTTSLRVSPEELVLDRPFLFVIHDTAHGAPLFVGRVADPS